MSMKDCGRPCESEGEEKNQEAEGEEKKTKERESEGEREQERGGLQGGYRAARAHVWGL